jgi:hypothetical protein
MWHVFGGKSKVVLSNYAVKVLSLTIYNQQSIFCFYPAFTVIFAGSLYAL